MRLDSALSDLESLDESYGYVLQAKGEAQSAMKAMQRPMSPEGLEAVSSALAARIEDIFAIGGLTVDQRRQAINRAIKSTINLCLTGVK